MGWTHSVKIQPYKCLNEPTHFNQTSFTLQSNYHSHFTPSFTLNSLLWTACQACFYIQCTKSQNVVQCYIVHRYITMHTFRGQSNTRDQMHTLYKPDNWPFWIKCAWKCRSQLHAYHIFEFFNKQHNRCAGSDCPMFSYHEAWCTFGCISLTCTC